MHFGLRLPTFALGARTATLAEMGRYLRRAEALGFEAAVTIDHLLTTPPAYACTWLEPLTLLAALAGVTERIRLGTMVLVLPLRNPVYFAKEWATLDVLSGGRSILGVGVGWAEEEFELMGVPRRERGRRTEEALELLQALWAGDRVSYEGRIFRVRDLTIDPKPVQKPHPPIWIGGGSQPFEKIYAQHVPDVTPVLRRVARYADAWVPHSSATPDMVQRDWAVIERAAPEFGRKAADIRVVYSNFVYVLRKGERPEAAAPRFATFSGMDLDYWREHYLLGEADAVVERINRRIAVVGGRMDWVVLNPVDWDPEQLERLAAEVLPRVTA
ncbi:MAG: LLM class flavin-dependent oxidoreductase [Candidatus Rokubacteria bacterium]|nr:LLM class flavin-dependent oxidoreductase [Candidatus Rokubacteria bacterium]